LGSLVPYLYASRLQDLRQHTSKFEVAFFVAFVFYAGATLVVLRIEVFSRRAVAASFGVAVVIQVLLLFTPPTLSDDMYRYVWDGRVQAQGISPYQYAMVCDLASGADSFVASGVCPLGRYILELCGAVQAVDL
jgi:hypothetical protein